MPWNWQRPDWPNFKWDGNRLAEMESRFLANGGVLIGTTRHLGIEDRNRLRVEITHSACQAMRTHQNTADFRGSRIFHK